MLAGLGWGALLRRNRGERGHAAVRSGCTSVTASTIAVEMR